MKKITILTVLVLGTSSLLFAQGVKTKQDTMSIILNGEHISLPVPRDGHKTTINLEDSASIIQISVGKTSKSRLPMVAGILPAADVPTKRTSWFNEADFGFTSLTGRKFVNGTDTAFGIDFSVGNTSGTNNRATIIKLAPKNIYAGFSVGLTIREKRRYIGSSKVQFITGSRFRYARFTGKGHYEITEIKASYNNGAIKYYPDSVTSFKSGEYRSVTNSFQLLFPFLFETKLKKNQDISFSAGINLAVNVHSSKFTENVRSTNTFISYINPQILQIQPVIKATYKRTSLYLSFNTGRTRIGYGSVNAITGNMLYFGLGYKLY